MGFTNYNRLLIELNNKQYYNIETYENFLLENGLDAAEQYVKENDELPLLETTHAILSTLLSNLDNYRKIETEFVTTTEASTSLLKRLNQLQKQIDKLKNEKKNDDDSCVSFPFFTDFE